MRVDKVAVLGAGNGGITAAADLTNRGFEVHLYDAAEFSDNLAGIRKNGGIKLKDASGETFVPFNRVTNNIELAIKDAQIVMITAPSFAIESIAEQLAPAVSESKVIFLNGAGSLSAIRFVNKARAMGIDKTFRICESNSLTYGTRAFAETAEVELSLYVKKLFFAAYPGDQTEALFEVCAQIYDCLVPADNIWHSTLENGNPEVHPGPSLLNVGRIDYSNGEFWLYKEGITEHTVKVLEAVQNERMAIGRAFGFDLENAVESRARRGYFNSETEDLQYLFNTSEVFTQIKGPAAVNSRYFTEDISNGLVLWSDLGRAAGVRTPNIDSVITLGSTILETDFFTTGLTLESLGLAGLDPDQLIENV